MEFGSRPERLVIGTRNPGKIREFRELLIPLRLALLSLDEFPCIVEPEETGASFHDNATIKATYYSARMKEWVLADDSGLEIDALGGRPGVLSSRYGGTKTGYSEKMRLLLDELDHVAGEPRSARFISVVTLSDPTGVIRLTAEGICEGTIANMPKGDRGFGYDPIFVPESHHQTFGEMTDEQKRELSHRARASDHFIRQMLRFMGV